MKTKELIKLLQPGDIGLTSSAGDSGIWDLIKKFQSMEDGEQKPTQFTHLLVFDKKDGEVFVNEGGIYESVLTIRRAHISKYVGKMICVMRNLQMTNEKFFQGREEIFDNLGQPYPAHHLIFHALDISTIWMFRKIGINWNKRLSNVLPLDWPVCSELGKQFCDKAGIETGINKKGWKGVNPDDFDDVRINRQDLWRTIVYVILEND